MWWRGASRPPELIGCGWWDVGSSWWSCGGCVLGEPGGQVREEELSWTLCKWGWQGGLRVEPIQQTEASGNRLRLCGVSASWGSLSHFLWRLFSHLSSATFTHPAWLICLFYLSPIKALTVYWCHPKHFTQVNPFQATITLCRYHFYPHIRVKRKPKYRSATCKGQLTCSRPGMLSTALGLRVGVVFLVASRSLGVWVPASHVPPPSGRPLSLLFCPFLMKDHTALIPGQILPAASLICPLFCFLSLKTQRDHITTQLLEP